MKLLNTQKNSLLEVIKDNGLSPLSFDYKDNIFSVGTGTEDVIIKYKDSEFYFTFHESKKNKGIVYEMSPGYNEFVSRSFISDFYVLKKSFNRWIEYLMEEINVVDEWKQLQDELNRVPFKDIFKDDAGKFSPNEINELKIIINTIQDKVRKIDLLPEQIITINKKLDHLIELTKDLKKTDWKELFLGAIFSTIMQLAIPPDTSTIIWSYIKSAFLGFNLLK